MGAGAGTWAEMEEEVERDAVVGPKGVSYRRKIDQYLRREYGG